jgi:glyoxylase-like metal-dependent hydrolase (beta-lactamase superfamily II)
MKSSAILVFLCCWFGPLFCAVDVYVFNVGQGNCIWVSIDVVEGENAGKKKILIVDCGSGNGNAWIRSEDFTVNLRKMGLFNDVCDYALWVTHFHADHYDLLGQNMPGCVESIYESVRYFFAGAGDQSFNYWPVSELPPQARIVRKVGEIEKKREEIRFELANTTDSTRNGGHYFVFLKSEDNRWW